MRAAYKRRRRNSRPEVGERLLVWFSNDRRIKVLVLLIAVPTRASMLPGSSAKARSKKPRACVRYWPPLFLQAISRNIHSFPEARCCWNLCSQIPI